MDSSNLKNNNYVWWGVACLTGAVLWSLPLLLNTEGKDGNTVFLIVSLALFLSAIVIGYFKPQRPWRWALASILLLPFIEFIALAQVPSLAAGFSLKATLLYALIKVPVYFIQGLPMLAGAYLGSYLKKRRAPEVIQPEVSDTVARGTGALDDQNKLRWVGFMFGFLGGVTYCIATPKAQTSTFLFSLSLIILFLSALAISFFRPQRVWRWALAVGVGFIGAVFSRIIIDSIQDPSSHRMFPFEIIISLVIATPCTFAGAYLGLFLNGILTRGERKVPVVKFGRPIIIVSLLLIVIGVLYMIITSRQGSPLEAGITLGKDIFSKTVVVSEPEIGNVTSIKALPDTMLLVVGDRGALMLTPDGRAKLLVKFDERLGKVEPVSVGSNGEFEYVNKGRGWQPVSLIGSTGKTIWKSPATETPDQMTAIDLDGDAVLEFVVGMNGDGGLKAFDRNGKELWMQPARNVFSVATIIVDGAATILHTDGDNLVIRSTKGEKLSTLTLPFISFTIGQWPHVEHPVIIGMHGATLSAFNFDGTRIGSLPILRNGTDMRTTPVLFGEANDTAYALVVSLLASSGLSELYLLDSRDTLIYHEVFKGMDPAVATIPAHNGAGESLLVGGVDGTVTEYSMNKK